MQRQGHLTNVQFELLNRFFDNIHSQKGSVGYGVEIDYLLYLESKPEVCYERSQKRGRTEEAEMSLDYLRDIHTLHEDWRRQKFLPMLPKKVKIVNVNGDFEQVLPIFASVREELLQLITKSI